MQPWIPLAGGKYTGCIDWGGEWGIYLGGHKPESDISRVYLGIILRHTVYPLIPYSYTFYTRFIPILYPIHTHFIPDLYPLYTRFIPQMLGNFVRVYWLNTRWVYWGYILDGYIEGIYPMVYWGYIEGIYPMVYWGYSNEATPVFSWVGILLRDMSHILDEYIEGIYSMGILRVYARWVYWGYMPDGYMEGISTRLARNTGLMGKMLDEYIEGILRVYTWWVYWGYIEGIFPDEGIVFFTQCIPESSRVYFGYIPDAWIRWIGYIKGIFGHIPDAWPKTQR